MLKLFNTLTKTISPIEIDHSPLRLYSCGPTVYDHAHIGNLRSFIFADTLRRTLELEGAKVDWVMNITDVDDKTIRKTLQIHGPTANLADLANVTDDYYKAFLLDLQELHIDTTSIRFIKVSEVIPEIQKFIIELLEKGFAYTADDGVYFSIEKYQAVFGDYGTLAGKDFLSGVKIGARVHVDEYDKENLSDFALWKKHTQADGEIFWDHPTLGPGRPGWHIECSAINKIAFDGAPTDIHTGGVDLIFPHHTNEIAQSQPLYNPFVRHWCHSEHLLVEGKKMAKSLENFLTLNDLKNSLGEFAPLAFRYLVLQSHYRSQMNFTHESLQAAWNGIQTLGLLNWDGFARAAKNPLSSEEIAKFTKALEDDLNTASALSAFWQTLQNSGVSAETKASSLGMYNSVLGIGFSNPDASSMPLEELPEEIKDLVTRREKARADKDFTTSDRLRETLEEKGFTIRDSPTGQVVYKK